MHYIIIIKIQASMVCAFEYAVQILQKRCNITKKYT